MHFAAHGFDLFCVIVAFLCFVIAAVMVPVGHRLAVMFLAIGLALWVLTAVIAT